MRSKRVIINAMTGFIGQALLIIVNLLSRKYFLNALGEDYLGVNSLFANVLTLLSMAELGIGSAITFSLYKPLAEKDYNTVRSLMKLFQLVYWFIGMFIFVVGLVLCPFLNILVKNEAEISNIQVIYIMFLFNTSVSYFFSYKSALIIADQNQYIFNFNHYICQFLMYVLQIITLKITNNYFIYLGCQIVTTVCENIIIAYIANHKYEFLKKMRTHKIELTTSIISEIKKNTLGMVLSKIGGTLVNSTDNILISAFIGVGVVGRYGNYYTISAAVGNVIYQVMNSTVASIGNFSINATNQEKKDIFSQLYFVSIWIYGFCCICLFCLLTPFVNLWYGDGYELSFIVVLLMVTNTFMTGASVLLSSYISALGLFWQNKYMGIIEAIINLLVSIILVKNIGLSGIILGTLISHIVWSIPIQSFLVIKNGLNENIVEYLVRYIKDIVVCLAVGFIVFKLCSFVQDNFLLGFIIKFLICVFVTNIFYFVIYCRSKDFKSLKNRLIMIINRK